MKSIAFQLMPHQTGFVFDTKTPIIGFMGGMRMGKSVASVHHAILLSAIHRGKHGALLSPTFGMNNRNIIPIFRDLNERYRLGIGGLDVKAPSILELNWDGAISTIHLGVSAENHDRLNGMTLAWAGLDEADKCPPEIAALAVEQMGIRTSDPTAPYPGQIFITSTPEGHSFMADYFIDNANPMKKLYTASMTDNYFLSQAYITRMLETIPSHKRAAYINGEPISFNVASVYPDFDNLLNDSPLTPADITHSDVVHVSFDLNLGGMSVVIAIDREGRRHVIDEWMKLKDTMEVMTRVTAQPWARQAVITCDPACTQVFPYIQKSGLRHRVMSSAPPIDWRITAVNARFCDGNGNRHLLINRRRCKVLVKCLINQAYVNGQPDKKTLIPEAGTDVSGPVDALGYLIYRDFPYSPRGAARVAMRGL